MQKAPNSSTITAKDLAEKNPVIFGIAKVLKPRKRNIQELDARKVFRLLKENNFEFSKEEYKEALLLLQKHGFGEVILGRRGRPTRLRWSGKMLDFIEAIIPTPTDEKDDQKTSEEIIENEPKNKKDTIIIRKGNVEIELPEENLSKNIKRLARLINKI